MFKKSMNLNMVAKLLKVLSFPKYHLTQDDGKGINPTMLKAANITPIHKT